MIHKLAKKYKRVLLLIKIHFKKIQIIKNWNIFLNTRHKYVHIF